MVELSELKPSFTPAVAAELIGSFLLLFLSGATAATAADNGLAAAALGYGLTLAILIYSTAHISGGHLNPAVTAGYMAVSANGFSTQEGVSYMLAQFVGAILGAFTLKLCLPHEALRHPFVTLGSLSDKHWGQVFLLEFVCTLILGFVVFATLVDRKRSVANNAGPLAIGLAYTIGVFAEGPFTGGSMNPARTLGPALAFGDFQHIWVYFVATYAAGIIAALGYVRLFGLEYESEGGEGAEASSSAAKYV